MKSSTAKIDLRGVMDLIPRSKYALAPLYEGVTNALEAIAQRYKKYGATPNGSLDIKLNFTGLLKETNELEKIEFIDNGIGFDEENFERFETLLDNTKGYNNRGSGRIQYLHRANKIEVTSFYKKDQKHFKRHFICDNSNYISNTVEEEDAEKHPSGSTVIISGFNHTGEEKSYFDNLDIQTLKNEIKNRFLLKLYLDKEKGQFPVPTITITFEKNNNVTGTETLKPNDIPKPQKSGKFKVAYVKIKDAKADDIDWTPIPKKNEKLSWAHFELTENELEHNGVFLCSKNVPVEELTFREIKKNESVNGHRFLTAIYGDVLDSEKNVSHSVDSFTLPYQKEIEKLAKGDLFFDPAQEFIFFDNIQKQIDKIIPDIYSEIFNLQQIQDKNIEAIAKAHGISLEVALSANINLTDTERQITDKIYKRQAENFSKDNLKIKQLYESLDKLNPTDADYPDELEKRSNELLNLIPQQNKEELSRYIIRRQMVTHVLKLILESKLDSQKTVPATKGKKAKVRKDKEGLIHDLIFKRKADSSKGLNDLWILNEEFLHFDGCSDLPISQIKDTKGKLLLRPISDAVLTKYKIKPDRRPDIFLYPDEGKCILVELKAPDVDLSDYLNQMPKYCNLIANFSAQPIQKFYCYLIGENFAEIDLGGEYRETVNGDWVKGEVPINNYENGKRHEQIASAQIEVIKLSSIYARANRRNKSFADKLGITDLVQK